MLLLPLRVCGWGDWGDWYDWYNARYEQNGSEPYVQWSTVLWNDDGDNEGFYDPGDYFGGGLHFYVSKDNGASYTYLGRVYCSYGSDNGYGRYFTTNNGAGGDGGELRDHGRYTNAVGGQWWFDWGEYEESCGDYVTDYTIRWYIPFEYRNMHLMFKCEGYWAKHKKSDRMWVSKVHEVDTWYSLTLQQIEWNGDYTLSADGRLTIPYKMTGSGNIPDPTYICTQINGAYASALGNSTPASHSGGSYSFNLSTIGKDMRSSFTITPYHERWHYGADLSNNRNNLNYVTMASKRQFRPVPKATNLNAVFSQLNRSVTLTWTGADEGNYSNGWWVIYRNGTKLGKVAQGTHTYTDSTFPTESDVSYCIYYIMNGWSDDTRRGELRSEDRLVNTTRTVPVTDLQAVSEDDRVTLTWTSNAYPLNWGNKFDVYIDDELATTITPTANQNKFTWCHLDDNSSTERVNSESGTTEDLDACQMHTYKVVGQIGGKSLNTAIAANKAIGSGTVFESFEATKGEYQGSVLLSWNVKRLENQARAETYLLERRRAGMEGDDGWQKLSTMDSQNTFLTYEDKTSLPGVIYEYRITVYNYCENGNKPTTTATDTGFAISSGVVSGRITFGTGSAVSGAKVTLKQNNDDGEITNHFRSLHFGGFGSGLKYASTEEEMVKLFGGDFSMQYYVFPDSSVMSRDGSQYVVLDIQNCLTPKLKYDKKRGGYWPSLTIYNPSTNSYSTYSCTEYMLPANAWSHVTLVHDHAARTYTYYITSEGQSICEVIGSKGEDFPESRIPSVFALGNYGAFTCAEYFDGYLDEFRLWTKSLTADEIQKNFNHPMAGTESSLAIYWPMDEGIDNQTLVYDFSKSNDVSNGHHAVAMVPAQSSTNVPSESQLSLMSYTDGQGNFVVRGIPYSGDGINYTIIPTLGIHEFSPAYSSRYISASSLVHSGVDFEDISSFPVSGTVYYEGTDYPVEGCNLYVDGQVCSKDGEMIETNSYGEFTISVPIGDHFIQVKKNGHTFTNNGRYPPDPNGVGTRIAFESEVKSLAFYDETVVNLTGRVVGGDIEGDKPIGFGQSKNNIGQALLTLVPQNSDKYRINVVKVDDGTTIDYQRNPATVPVLSSKPESIQSEAWRGADDDSNKFFILTDPVTGEFSALVPPLSYTVQGIHVMSSDIDVIENPIALDMTEPQVSNQDSLVVEGEPTEYYDYHTLLRQVYHATPTFHVTQKGRKDGSFGIKDFTIEDADGSLPLDDIYSTGDDGTVTYNYGVVDETGDHRAPIFKMTDRYTFELEGYEEYVNKDSGTPVYSTVPLANNVVTIENALADTQEVWGENNAEGATPGSVNELKANQLELDAEGKATYTWKGGLPNITPPYTRNINFYYNVGGKTIGWEGNPLEAIILGDLPTGNNFVTSGPQHVDMILRDPPGSQSSATWESGTTTETITVKGGTWSLDEKYVMNFYFGASVTSGAGIGAFIINSVDVENDVNAGLHAVSEGWDAKTTGRRVTATQAISTSDSPEYDGAMGDLFIGSGTNIIFGASRHVGLYRDPTDATKAVLNMDDAITTGLKFGTQFVYTQHYIENDLLPNLRRVRDSFLTHYSGDVTQYTNSTNKPVYLTGLLPDAPNYGAENTYTMIPPANQSSCSDTILYFNEQMRTWINYLAQNEREKVKAYEKRAELEKKKDKAGEPLALNYSFDAGSTVTNTFTVDTISGTKLDWSVSTRVILGGGHGFAVNNTGVSWELATENGGGDREERDSTHTETTTFSYTLKDTDVKDALSVDVYKQQGEHGSPIFRTRGGQTCNPYEGRVETKYHEPGRHVLMEATMRVEMPKIGVDQPIVSDIPSGSAANYTVRLANQSEINAELYYLLMVPDETNPNGAQIIIDGLPLTEPRRIKLPYGETLTKSLQLKQSDPSILDYDRIAIVLASIYQNDPTDNMEVIADTAWISAHFVPSASPVTLALSTTTMNTQTGTDLTLTLKDFDRNFHGQKAFRLQYKPQGGDWTDFYQYVLNEDDMASSNCALLPKEGATVTYKLPMYTYSDGNYIFRAVSVSTYGTDEIRQESNEIAMVKDTSRPRPLGLAEPADGILDIGDELSVTFNEPFIKGELTATKNFFITGVLNGTAVAHQTALQANSGISAPAAQTETSINLNDKDFSLDMWVNITSAGTLLSHGKGTQKMTVSVNADRCLVVTIGEETYTSTTPVPFNKWMFLTLGYTSGETGGKLSVSVATDDQTLKCFNEQAVTRYFGDGPLSAGCGAGSAIHELLLWDEARDIETALMQRSVTKNPATRHLIGYWKMDEGEGTTLRDYSRNRHMEMPAESWYLNNVNKSVALDGTHHLAAATSTVPPQPQDDYAIEFWMRCAPQSDEAQVMQLGEVGLWLNSEGELQLESNSSTFSAQDTQLTDNAWHHIALNVLRLGTATLYVDGTRVLTTQSRNIGRLSSDSLLIGARRTFNTDWGAYTYDRPFIGQIDEIRLWNATMNGDLLARNRKVRLTGQEPGLSLYYPFETKQLDEFNQVVAVGTAAEITGNGTDATLNTTASTLSFADDAPALREKPVETNVSFGFTASNEKIVIDINETPAKIEGCTLNFTVREVRDENGNYSMPATWSAFVHRNELSWLDSEVSCTTEATVKTTLTATIVNRSGSAQLWTLNGLPSWLTVSSDHGTTPPLSETTLTFYVSESTPIGKYHQTVYLTGNNGIDTPLTLHVTVTGDIPDWAASSGDYTETMNMISVLNIIGKVSEDDADMVAAFIDGECRGVAHPDYNKRYDRYFVTMDIYGNEEDVNKPLTFKAYDASTGIIYPVVKTYEDDGSSIGLAFESNTLIGRYATPMRLSATNEIEQSIALGKGWNWMSLSVHPDNFTVPVVFSSANGRVVFVKGQTSGFKQYNNGVWNGRLNEMNSSQMYAVQTTEPFTLGVIGHSVVTTDEPIIVKKGWNWIGYNAQGLLSVTDALAGMNPTDGDIIKGQRGIAYYDDFEWSGSLKTLTPGKGYKIQSASDATRTFSYPHTTASGSRAAKPIMKPESLSFFEPVDYSLYPANMVLIAQVVADGQPVSGAELGIFAGKECREATVTDEQGMVFITIPGDEAATLHLRVAVDGELFAPAATLTYETDAVVGSPRKPFVIELGTATAIAGITDGQGSDNVYDLGGRKIVSSQWFKNRLSKGIYIVNGQKKVK